MDFETFKSKYVETMMYYQVIEHDIKFIYAYMLRGDINKHFDDIETTTLGNMINKLRDLVVNNSMCKGRRESKKGVV